MSQLASLITDDLSDEIALLPKRPGYSTLPPRSVVHYVTFHYSAVVYTDRSEQAERARIIAEARDHLNRNWGERGKPPVYGDGLMYDLVVLSSGAVIKTRARGQQLWHCGNPCGNRESLSVHVMLGAGQALTDPQRNSLYAVFDAARADYGLARDRIVGHCEWPRLVDRAPVIKPFYHLEPSQSACPGDLLFRSLAAYRAQTDAPATDPWAEWGDQFPLPVDQRGWGIAQLWYQNRAKLGPARSIELYSPDGARSVRFFRNGMAIYEAETKHARIVDLVDVV